MPSIATLEAEVDGATTPAVGVVIVSWNVRELLLACLASVAAAPTRARVVVVDNASSDGSVDALRLAQPHVEVVANATNVGFTRANNQGLRLLGVGAAGEDAPEVVVLLNPDTEIRDDALGALARYLAGHADVGAAGPKLLNADGSHQSSARRFPGLAQGLAEGTPLAWHWPRNPAARRMHMADAPPRAAGPVDWVSGAVLALRTSALEAVGLLDEGFFMYSEELDLCRRLTDAGWATHYVPEAVVVHHEGQSSGQAVPARHVNFQRSRVRYFCKHRGRVVGALVRWGVLAQFAAEALLEQSKALAGSKPELRRARVAAYRLLLRDGLRDHPAAAVDGA